MTRPMLRAAAMVVLVGALGCRQERRVELDFSRTAPPVAVATPRAATLRIAIGAMVSPESTYASYADYRLAADVAQCALGVASVRARAATATPWSSRSRTAGRGSRPRCGRGSSTRS